MITCIMRITETKSIQPYYMNSSIIFALIDMILLCNNKIMHVCVCQTMNLIA